MLLGLSEEEFWSLDLRELAILRSTYEEAERRADLRAGMIASVLTAIHGAKGTRIRQPAEWFPWGKKRPPTIEEMFAIAQQIHSSSKEIH